MALLYGLRRGQSLHQPKQLCPSFNKKNGKCNKQKIFFAEKHVIYSWLLESPFQMQAYVKQSINITCAGAFMGSYPLLLIYISQQAKC